MYLPNWKTVLQSNVSVITAFHYNCYVSKLQNTASKLQTFAATHSLGMCQHK